MTTTVLWAAGWMLLIAALTYAFAFRAGRTTRDGHLSTDQWRTAVLRGVGWSLPIAVAAGVWLIAG